MITTHDIDRLEKELRDEVDGEVRFDTASRALYVSDGSNYRQIPIGVVIPRSADTVEKLIGICRRYGVPIVSRGAGTSLCGQTCNVAVVIDFSKYLHHIIEIDPEKKRARVQPGTILDHLRDTAKKKYDLTFGPDPATHNHCTLGGMIGNNSCGIHSVMAGRTVDNVHELEILTYDGLRMRVGPTGEEELNRIISEGGRKGDIYLRLRNLRDRYADLIRKRYPKLPRRVSGYNLDELLPENGFNVARALVGTESTCVTVLEATLRLVWSPPGRSLLVLGYPDVYSSGDHIPQIMGFKPIGCEGVDSLLVDYMEKKGLNASDIKLLPEGRGWLLAEFGGHTKEESDDLARRAMEELRRTPNPPAMKLYTDPREEELVWQIRESGLGATANVPGEPLSWPGWEDAAVPPDQVGNYLREFRALLNEFGYRAALYGHFGQGCIHCRISFDLFTHEGISNFMRFLDKASDLVVKYGGSFSAEHGDGQSKALYLPKMYGEELMHAFREFKSIWDPEWKMNPGKIVEPYRPDENLRLGAAYEPWQPDTHFKFPDDKGSFSRATLRCVGVGKCRRPNDAFMCPSFLATREEEHTTRGRAHMLFEMFRGDLIKDGWKSREVFESLELCLGCKGCKGECPVNVDMATYKSEFHAHYYKKRMRPRSHYSMGLVGFWANIAEKMPGLANFFTQTPGLRGIAKALAGIAPERSIPKFAPIAFSKWFPKHGRVRERGEKVLLYPDFLNDFFFPETLAAAADVLDRWGFQVVLPPERPPALRPLLHYGMLGRTKRELRKAISLLRPFAEGGMPIIILEPSAASVYRDDMLQLFPDDRDGERIAKLTYLISEFAEERKLEIPRLEGKAIFHGHCHQKAVLNVGAARNILNKMGLEYEEPQPGCCGMAGSFGLEPQTYGISMKIAEEQLLPVVRKAPRTTYVIADGFSCREQIMEGARRRPLHMAELLQKAFAVSGRQAGEGGKAAPGEKKEEKGGEIMRPREKPEVVVVTGGTAGVGRATVREFARRGARIGILARGKDRLEETQREVEELGGEAIGIPTDVADPVQVERAAAEVERAFGPIDIWVNNAMASVFAPFKDMTPDEFRRVTEVTYLGQVYGTMAALKRMLPRDRGTIVQVGSALAIRSIPLQAAYCGAKHGVRGFTDSIRSELEHDKSNVHITMVQLPAMNTPQFDWVKSKLKHKAQPVPPIFQPEVGAGAIVWAAHHKRREVDAGWPTVKAILGQKVAPGFADRYLAEHNYQAQQTEEPEDPNRPDNLYEPVEGNYEAHGRFNSRARRASVEFWASKHKKHIGWGLAAAGLAAIIGIAAKEGNHKKKTLEKAEVGS